MPRPLRPDIENGWFHVMNRGIDHCDVFLDDSDRVEYGQRLADVYERYGILTHAYCLMDTHFHHLWQCPDGGLSAAMQRLGSLYTRHVNDRVGRDGALFRGRFHSRLITDDSHLVATVRYIHRNALELRGVNSAKEYRWSSHRTYLGLRKKPEWLRTSTVLDGWDLDGFDQFVDEPLGSMPKPTNPAAELLIEAIELVLAEQDRTADRRVGAIARQIALAYFVDVVAMTNDALMVAFEIERLGTLRTAVSRARTLMRSDPGLLDVQSKAVGLLTVAPITTRV